VATQPRGYPTWHPHSTENDSFILYVGHSEETSEDTNKLCFSFSLSNKKKAPENKREKKECVLLTLLVVGI